MGPVGDTNYNADGSDPVTKFTFTEEFLAGWDQVWLFGDYPANQSDDHTLAQFFPLDQAELRCLAEWMDRGGGVFAAGDHWNLGASMCWRIPRVRSMRRWTKEQGVPSMNGNDRHETLQPNPDVTQDPEGDTIPQPIDVVRWRVTASDLVRPTLPHAVLATPTGAIETFPDHMHEGDVIVDDQVQLDNPLDIIAYDRPEYPFVPVTINPGSAGTITVNDSRSRPRPHVAAYGRTTNLSPPVTPVTHALAARESGAEVTSLTTKQFALIGTYDGDSVGIGRVVVESTWHHWFSLNLHGFAGDGPDAQYGLMQTYYRNVAMWLATPAQRQLMLSSLIWATVVSDPMAFPLAPPSSLWSVGEKALGVISRCLSQSMLVDIVASMYGGRPGSIFGVPGDVDESAPYGESVPIDLALRAIVGGIASAFIKPAYNYLGSGPRPLLDPEGIAGHFAEGVAQGHRALMEAIQARAAAAEVVADRLAGFKPSSPGVPIALVGLRVIVEGIQFPDPTDPALANFRPSGKGKRTTLSISLRISVGNTIIASDVVKRIEVPAIEPAGAFLKLDRVLYDGMVQSGEALVIEAINGESGSEPVAAERLRFKDTLSGDPSGWIGAHPPSRSQPWRLLVPD